jgi:hypothetical protein
MHDAPHAASIIGSAMVAISSMRRLHGGIPLGAGVGCGAAI